MSDLSLKPQKKLLYEVSIIRPLIIFLLVFLHSFTKIIYGAGDYHDYQLPFVYQWICNFIVKFRIENIALIAGYVFSYQCNDLKRSYVFGPFIIKKFKRLIIPMIFFGIIYYFCFFFKKETFTIQEFIISVLSGCGHLWFLPMLFWCFISIWIIDHFKISSWPTLIVLAVFSMVPLNSLPFGFGRFPHFLFFVYLGYFLWIKRNSIFKICLKKKVIIGLWLLYIFLVIVFYNYMPSITEGIPIIKKRALIVVSILFNLLTSCCGILALYLTVCRKVYLFNYKPKNWVILASNDCYGLYVYHQFILVWLYFYTPLYDICNEYLLPWIGFIITLCISMILTKLSLKTKLGKYLIG